MSGRQCVYMYVGMCM